MVKLKKFGILIVCLMLISALIGCVEPKSKVTPNSAKTPTPNASIPDYDVSGVQMSPIKKMYHM
ncbi:hypothetical protein DRP05_08485 [Archaeoglobales archaeon]|nr:MAG: hypothetical protein DRP05_08485 [Archaeoglobales archaeon]